MTLDKTNNAPKFVFYLKFISCAANFDCHSLNHSLLSLSLSIFWSDNNLWVYLIYTHSLCALYKQFSSFCHLSLINGILALYIAISLSPSLLVSINNQTINVKPCEIVFMFYCCCHLVSIGICWCCCCGFIPLGLVCEYPDAYHRSLSLSFFLIFPSSLTLFSIFFHASFASLVISHCSHLKHISYRSSLLTLLMFLLPAPFIIIIISRLSTLCLIVCFRCFRFYFIYVIHSY